MYLSHIPGPPTCSSVADVTHSASSAEHECKAKQGSCSGGHEAAEERLSLCKALPQPPQGRSKMEGAEHVSVNSAPFAQDAEVDPT